ncbi:MAG: tyrosine-type recombinase/integrase [Oligoflexia bacterium]|nr:tyrosine-type recombinase/integrase [Oligoflexia bacterium]
MRKNKILTNSSASWKNITNYLSYRKSLGHKIINDFNYLRDFYNFINANKLPKIIDHNSVTSYFKSKEYLKPMSKKTLLTVLDQYCKYLYNIGVSTYIPSKNLIPKYSYIIRAYIYKRSDIIKLLEAIEQLRISPLTMITYKMLICLAWCTGMRPTELINLNNSDVDLKNLTIEIRKTKFGKSRIVPIHKSTKKSLELYIKKKSLAQIIECKNDSFLIGTKNKRINRKGLCEIFRNIAQKAGLRGNKNSLPTVKDFRHTFATNTLNRCYRKKDLDPNIFLPVLSTYLGHSNLRDTQYYLHCSLELLQRASITFEKSIIKRKIIRGKYERKKINS